MKKVNYKGITWEVIFVGATESKLVATTRSVAGQETVVDNKIIFATRKEESIARLEGMINRAETALINATTRVETIKQMNKLTKLNRALKGQQMS